MKANASNDDPHADLTVLGPADSNLISLGSWRLSVPLCISLKANFNLLESKDLVVPIKGSVIVPNLGLTLVGNTLKTDKQPRIQTIISLLFFQSIMIERSLDGIIVGNPRWSFLTSTFETVLGSGEPAKNRITSLNTSLR